MAALAIIHKQAILDRLSKGELGIHIAKSLGCSLAAISQVLAKDPSYRAARQTGAEQRLEEQFQAIETADDPLKLARARELWKAAAWFAEREFPERWGQKQEIINTQPPSLTINVVQSGQRSGNREVDITPIADSLPHKQD